MSSRKIAGLLAAGGLTVGPIGGGVGAVFQDTVTAKQNIDVGTFACKIVSATPLAASNGIAVGGKSLTFTSPTITSSAAGSAPFSFTVQNTGTIPQSLTVTSTWTGDLSSHFTSILATPTAAVPLAASGTQVYNAGIQWTTLDTNDLGTAGSITYTVNCGEAAAGPAFNVDYYTTTGNTDSPFHRYSAPQASVSLGAGNGTASQVVNLDGSITLSLSGVTGYGDTGFYVPMGQLGSLPTYTITASSGTVATNLYLDNNTDGIFGNWTGDTWVGLAGDSYGLGATSGATLTVDGSFLFNSWQGAVSGNHTVAGLKALYPASTQVWAWVGIQGTGSLSATITAAP